MSNPKEPDLVNDEATTLGVLASQVEDFHGFQLLSVEPPTDGKAVIAVVPRGKTIVDLKAILDKFLPFPDRRRGIITTLDKQSFIDVTNRFKGPNSVVFYDPKETAPAFRTVFDHHPAGDASGERAANWLEHSAKYVPALSQEWQDWTECNDTAMHQGDFAEFIEDSVMDLIEPHFDDPRFKTYADIMGGSYATPSQLVTLSRGLQLNINAKVKNAVTLANGTIQVGYDEEHDTNGVVVPNLFMICIPVFRNGAQYRLAVRLRYKVMAGAITWTYLIVNKDLAMKDAINQIVTDVKTETALPVFAGAAEK